MEREIYEFHKEVQFRHWWFNGRRKIIAAFLENYKLNEKIQILDIGSGFGSTVPTLRQFGAIDVMEPFKEAHPILKSLGAQQIYDMGNFPENYPKRKYDWVTMFDVLEHIEDDCGALHVVFNSLLKQGGRFFITVPAHMWLWTGHDEVNHHYRRYDRLALLNLMRNTGFVDIRVSYYMTFLFPLAVVERILKKLTQSDNAELRIPSTFINRTLEAVFSAERLIIRRANFPFGLSLIACGRKPN